MANFREKLSNLLDFSWACFILIFGYQNSVKAKVVSGQNHQARGYLLSKTRVLGFGL